MPLSFELLMPGTIVAAYEQCDSSDITSDFILWDEVSQIDAKIYSLYLDDISFNIWNESLSYNALN